MNEQNICCCDPDYHFYKKEIENEGVDNFHEVEYYGCANCGNVETLETLMPEDTGK